MSFDQPKTSLMKHSNSNAALNRSNTKLISRRGSLKSLKEEEKNQESSRKANKAVSNTKKKEESPENKP